MGRESNKCRVPGLNLGSLVCEQAPEVAKEEPVDLNSTDQFPPLGAHPSGKPKKAKFRGTKKH